MIIGSGMLARLFVKYAHDDKVVIFASGVSNSAETRESEFRRERDLLLKVLKENSQKHIVYFSTCSMNDPASSDSLYLRHKLNMEKYVVDQSESYHVFRLPQLIGRASNKTLVNHIVNSIKLQKKLVVYKKATRNLVALNEVFLIIDYILSHHLFLNQTLNIANSKNISVLTFVRLVEKALGKKANLNLLDQGVPYEEIKVDKIASVVKSLGINLACEAYYLKAIRDNFI